MAQKYSWLARVTLVRIDQLLRRLEGKRAGAPAAVLAITPVQSKQPEPELKRPLPPARSGTVSSAARFTPNPAADGHEYSVSSVMLFEEFLPFYDVSDEVATVVSAGQQTTWDALMDADLIEVGRQRPLVALLGAVRILPDVVWQRLHGEHPDTPERLTLRDTTKLPMSGGGWVLLGEQPPEEIALGLVGKFWRPVIEFANVEATAFKDWAEPGFAKTIYALGTRRLDDQRTLLWAMMRTATTDEHARSWFQRYWTFGVGSGAHVLARALIDVVREEAEQRATPTGGG